MQQAIKILHNVIGPFSSTRNIHLNFTREDES